MPVYFKDDIAKAEPRITNERLKALLNSREPRVVRFFARLWRTQQNSITYQELRDMVITGQIDSSIINQWYDDYSRFVVQYLMPEWDFMALEAVKVFERRYPQFAFDPGTAEVARFASRHAAELVTNSTSQQIEAIRAMVKRASVVQDVTVDELAYMIRPCVGLYKGQAVANLNYYRTVRNNLQQINPNMRPETAEKRAKAAAVKYAEKQHRYRAHLIARSELCFAYNMGEYNGVRQAQALGYMGHAEKEWVTAHDERVCERCKELDGKRVGTDELFPGEDVLIPPLHPHCLVPGTKVIAGDIIGGSIRRFKGSVITICTSNGNELTVTPNHPILTDRGWIAAGKIKKCDKVVEARSVEGVMDVLKAQDYNVPTAVEEIADAFLKTHGVTISRVPISAEDFHGDGIDGDIGVIYANSFLGDNRETAITESVGDNNFGDGRSSGHDFSFMGSSEFQTGFNIDRFSTNGGVRSTCECGFFSGGHQGKTDNICFTTISEGNTGVSEDFVDCGSFNVESFGERETGGTGSVRGNNIIPNSSMVSSEVIFGVRGFEGAEINGFEKPPIEGTFTDAEAFADFRDREPGFVQFADVVDVRVKNGVDIHVYNLHTKSGVYIANGIITHNCRCVINYIED